MRAVIGAVVANLAMEALWMISKVVEGLPKEIPIILRWLVVVELEMADKVAVLAKLRAVELELVGTVRVLTKN